MNNVLLYTSIFGPYDDLREVPPQTVSHDSRCYTDQNFQSATWKIEKRRKIFSRNRIRAARNLKIAQSIHGYEFCIYLDGAFQILRPDFVEFMLSALNSHDFAMLGHPHRNCVYDEAEACLMARKGEPHRIRKQIAKYNDAGLPKNSGLWASSCFAFRNNESTYRFRQAWWRELRRNSTRDQIALPYIVWKTQFATHMRTINEDMFNNSYIHWIAHRS